MNGDYWIIIGVLTAAFSLFAIPYGFHLKASSSAEQVPLNIGGDFVSGHKITQGDYVEGDKVSGDKIINQEVGQKQLEEALEKALKSKNIVLLEEVFPGEHSVFGVSGNSIVAPHGNIPDEIEVKWSTGRVINNDETSITLVVPTVAGDVGGARSMNIVGVETTLSKQVGATTNIMNIGGIYLNAKVIGIDGDMVVIGLGFIPDPNWEKKVREQQ